MAISLPYYAAWRSACRYSTMLSISIPMPARRNRKICASSKSTLNPAIQGEERYARIECRLHRHARADVHVADRLQSRFSVVHRRLQPLQHSAGHFPYCGPQNRHTIASVDPNRTCIASMQLRRHPAHAMHTGCDWRICAPDGVFCDPQLGCSDRLVARGSVRRTCLAVEPGIPAGVEFQRAVQFQRRRQLSALRDGRKLLRLHQHADALPPMLGACSDASPVSDTAMGSGRFGQFELPDRRVYQFRSLCAERIGDRRRHRLHLYRSQSAHQPQQ